MAGYYHGAAGIGTGDLAILLLALVAAVWYIAKQMKSKKNGEKREDRMKKQDNRGEFMQEKNAPSAAIGLGVFNGSVMYTKLLIAAVLAISAISDAALYLAMGFRLPMLMMGLVKFAFAAIVYMDVLNSEKAMEKELGRRK